MAQYNFSRIGKSSRRVEIRKGGFRIRIGALLLAFLLACLVWLYMDGHALRKQAEEEGTAAETTVATVAVGEITGDMTV